MTPGELQKRLKNFAYKAAKICGLLPYSKICKIIEDQLIRSAFYEAANYRAACKAQSIKRLQLKSVSPTRKWTNLYSGLKR